MLSVTFAPNDSTDYTIASASVTLSVTAVTSAPVVTTGSASVILGSSATMGGQATAEGSDTHVWFLYGTSNTPAAQLKRLRRTLAPDTLW